MGEAYVKLGQPQDALPLFRQAREILRTALGENHPDHAISLNNLAGLYAAMGCASAGLGRRLVRLGLCT